MKMSEALEIVEEELRITSSRFPPFHSTHEGYAVLREEVDELWDEIKGNSGRYDLAVEAKQVAAMALRFLVDCC